MPVRRFGGRTRPQTQIGGAGKSSCSVAFLKRWLCYSGAVATDLLEIDPFQPSEAAIDRAAMAIRRGKVVAIPTDALYTLVADPFSLHAVRQVYLAKGRHLARSLPLLVRDAMMVEDLARDISVRFKLLTRKFWPGALTIIVPAAANIPLKVTGDTGRLAVRHASSVVVDQLLARIGQPLVSTSANISGMPTCKSGIDVFGTMDGRVDLVLDGGLCVGTGASTVDITEPEWKMIKEGAISYGEIADCLEGAE